jgi:hypothetical protein
MEKECLELGSIAQKAVAVYALSIALLSMVSHNLQQKMFSLIVQVHQNGLRNKKVWVVINVNVNAFALAVAAGF